MSGPRIESRIDAAILISGRGSNMAALARAATAPDYPVRFVRVVSNVADAPGLALARELGLETRIVPSAGRPRSAFEADLADALDSVGLICLAGFMRVLSPGFVAARAGRILNIHPSLLPAHPGLAPQAAALAAGDAEAGCTVHAVTADVDAGPVLARERVPVLPGDDVTTLSARILDAEHRCYPAAVASHAAKLHARTRGEAA